MMKTLALLLLSMVLVVGVATAQLYPPSGLNANNHGDGTVTLTWSPPPVTDAASIHDLIDWPETDAERAGWQMPDEAELQQRWADLQASGGELDDLVFYFIYRNGQQFDIVYDTVYEDQLPQTGAYTYAVSAFYDAGESDLTDEVSVTWYDQVNFIIEEDFESGFPDGWIIEGTMASNTWHVADAPFSYQQNFPTQVMLIDSDAAGSGPHIQERLILPNFDFSQASFVELSYDYFFQLYIEEHLYVQYRINGGAWQTIADYSTTVQFADVLHDLTLQLAGEPDADISFYYDDMDNWGWYTGFDDLSLQRDVIPDDPVILDLIGMKTRIPETGGVVGYDVSLVSTLPNTVTNVKYWATVTNPNGNESDPVAVITFTHTPFMDVFYPYLQQLVPANAPAGEYTYTGYVGLNLNNPQLEDSFTFTKQGAAQIAGTYVIDPAEWPLTGWPETAASGDAKTLPSDYELQAAWPNPFNATTTLSLRLPESAPVKVAVYNVTGREVAVLADGRYAAGSHALAFDGSRLASGVYFVRATVPGQLNSVQKLVLMK